jgi:HEAT repeat protein
MTTREIVNRLLQGESFDRGLERLQKRPRAAIRQLHHAVEGKALDTAVSGVQQREAGDIATAALCALGASHAELLIEFLDRHLVNGTSSSSFALTWALAHSGTTAGLRTSAKALEHKDRFVRWAACTDLARRRGDGICFLLNKAASDRASLVRSTAVEALISSGDHTSLPVLENRLRDRYPGIRGAAAKAIDAINARQKGKRTGAHPK